MTITHDPTTDYVRCQESEIPAGVRFDVPRFFQGQIVQIAYGGFERSPHGPGSPYLYRKDQSTGIVEYYRLCGKHRSK